MTGQYGTALENNLFILPRHQQAVSTIKSIIPVRVIVCEQVTRCLIH